MIQNVWLIGAGIMALDYFKVLRALNIEPVVVGRSEKSCDEFYNKTGWRAQPGGLKSFLQKMNNVPEFAIVAVSREELASTTAMLGRARVKNILVEKPAALSLAELQEISRNCESSNVVVGFNRRFYSSVLKARELIANDNGVESFTFDFTEWSHRLKELVPVKGEKVMRTWFLGNSVHVPDLAFYLCGKPTEISCLTSGSLDWHPSSAIFAGSGNTETGALFSYHANWQSAGRWSLEIMTPKRKIVLRPLEELQQQLKGSVSIEPVELNNELDQKFKPGLYLQTEQFLSGNISQFETLSTLKEIFPLYLKMAGYRETT